MHFLNCFFCIIYRTYISNIFLKCLVIFERQRQHEQGEAERGDPESEAGSRLQAVSTEPKAGLRLMDFEIMT